MLGARLISSRLHAGVWNLGFEVSDTLHSIRVRHPELFTFESSLVWIGITIAVRCESPWLALLRTIECAFVFLNDDW